ncbi:glycoside hydrolase family 3 C-terminal domain-containing protein [Pseudomonas savastanoi]|uniref:Beta-D-glucoside glucohydrolase n=2 Tax=Pseudomonas savastanoi TaxID=29438 RepID=A0AAW5JAM1_PSESS|nr:glycoside hydrolase family 3 C-terminal domain-containing protein [Pseudomonas savastanoi]MCQ3023538.1 glycoside hydrolase family 3 C-terminal domain-containing protein [Pseudomonas savastanoi]
MKMQLSTRRFLLCTSLAAFPLAASFPSLAAPPIVGEEVEKKVEAMLGQMSTSDKLTYITSDAGHILRAVPQLGLPATISVDSSMGIYRDVMFGTQYPSQSALAATWSIPRAKEFGLAIGYDTRAAGAQQVLSPGMNMYRTPLTGRAAEHVSGEDPFLGAVMGPAITNAIQAQGVMTAVKHFVANEQDANRHALNVHVSSRALREIYMPGFESVVRNANPASFMCGFNKINDEYACESHNLLFDTLKGEWGFKGFVISDYNAITNGLKAAQAGADVDSPGGLQMNEKNLTPYLYSGELPQVALDDKIRRNLRGIVSYGFDKGLPTPSGIGNDPRNISASLHIAREGIVLLKNESIGGGAKLLPLKKDAKIAVIGDIANQAPPSPFGTAYSKVENHISEIEGLKKIGTGQVDYIKSMSLDPQQSVWWTKSDSDTAPGKYTNGLKAEYYNNADLSGAPALTRTEPGLNWDFASLTNTTAKGDSQLTSLYPQQGNFSARFTTRIKPTVSGNQVFKVRADGSIKLWVNNKLIIDDLNPALSSDLAGTYSKFGRAVKLEAGQMYDVRLEYSRANSKFIPSLGGLWGIQMSWASLAAPENLAQYDAVYVAAGINNEYEGEASDHGFDLPEYQDEMIKNVIAANDKTLVVMHAGGTLNVSSWINKANGFIHAWYPGAQAGRALAEIVFGDVNPSGKLPVTWDRNLEDNPSYASYPDPRPYQGDHALSDMTYKEDIFMGYRGYDKSHKKPLFPFGYGQSYTTYDYSGLSVSPKVSLADTKINVKFTVTNSGKVAGYEVAQVYVSPLNSKIDRPIKELKGFKKIFLQPGETKEVSIPLDSRSLAYFDTTTWNWIVDAGQYRVLVGGSSDSLPLKNTINSLYRQVLPVVSSNPLPANVRESVQVDSTRAY